MMLVSETWNAVMTHNHSEAVTGPQRYNSSVLGLVSQAAAVAAELSGADLSLQRHGN